MGQAGQGRVGSLGLGSSLGEMLYLSDLGEVILDLIMDWTV